MNGTIMFSIRMQDMMSTGLMKLTSNSNSAFAKMSNHTKQLGDKNKVLSMSYNELQTKIKQVEDTIEKRTIPNQIASARRELASLQRMSNNHLGNTNNKDSGAGSKGLGIGGVAMGSMLGGLATQGLSIVSSTISGGISAMISKSMDKETAINGLSTFIGKQGATDTYKNIRKDAEATPFDTASLLEVNRALISAGASAKTARIDSINLANAIVAVGGSNDTLTRMAANMQQIKTVGKATAMDVKQFGMAGINIYEMLSRSTGKSIAQVREMDVTYEQLSKAMEMASGKGGIYENALKNAQSSKWGKWSNITESIRNSLGDIGDAFDPLTHKVLDLANMFSNNIQPILERIKPYINGFADGFSKVIDYVTQIKNTTGGWMDYMKIAENHFLNVWSFAQKIGSQLWRLVSSIIDFVKNSEIIKDIFRFIGNQMEITFKVIGWIFDKLIMIWEKVLKPVLSAIDGAYKWLKGTDEIKIKATQQIIHKKSKDNPSDSPLGSGAAMMASNTASGKTAGDTVSGAGPKTVNIHLGKFFDTIQFTTIDGKETVQELEKVVMECLARVLYNGSKTV